MEDPYAWLADPEDPATLAYLEAENAYCEDWFAPHTELCDAVFHEIRSRIQETDEAVPSRKGTWWYSARTVEGLSYPIHCRGRSRETATGTVLLDENTEAGHSPYFAVGAFEVSPDHTRLAWSSDHDGSEKYALRIRDLITGVDLPDRIEPTHYGSAWSADGEWIFYTVPDEAMRPHQVWRHRVGTDQADDVLVFEEFDEHFFIHLELTRSGDWIIINPDSHLTSEVWLLPAADPTSAPRLVRVREHGHEYTLDHWGERFVVLSNLGAEDFQVLTAPLDSPVDWTVLVPHQAGRRITGVEPFAGHLVLHEWADAQPGLRVLFGDGRERRIDVGVEPSDVELGPNLEYDTTVVRFEYQSLTTPHTSFEEDVVSGARVMLKRTPTPGVDLTRYESAREWATAADGVRVPVDLVWRRGTPRDGTGPVLLYGYGAYETSMAPWFSVGRLSLLDRGWVWGLTHPRGGGELGRRWYLDGKLLQKRNTFTDVIASAEHVAALGYASADRISLQGGSAGGLLVGACMNLRPDLFAAVVAEVPFVDVVTPMSDPSLPLTVIEWEEWGDPRQEPYATYMLGYSPYDNTVPGNHPALYVTAGLNDPRVSYDGPAKWVARLRELGTGDRPLVFKVDMGAGHGGPSGRYDAWRDYARVLTFLLRTV